MSLSLKKLAAVLAAGTGLFGLVDAPIAASGVEIHGAGSTFAAPLYEKWMAAFEAAQPSISLHYDAVGSGEGVARFRAGAADFGASDAPLPATDASTVDRGVVQVPSTAGMIVLAYNLPGVQGQLKLPQDVYVDIFLGKIRTWDDPRILEANTDLDLPSTNIALIGRRESSGTTYALTSHLAAVSPSWREEGPGVGKLVEWPNVAMLARGNEGVAAKIKLSEGSIGYVEYGFAKRLGLPAAALENKDGQYVVPSEDAGAAALAASAGHGLDEHGLDGLPASLTNPPGPHTYPIVTYSWLLLHERYPAAQAQAVASFVSWALEDGQR
ncbi:phosphate ABC transporter substrate-binding protein PstS [Methylocapsa palsarum]|uniref:Phosphate-binding protein PstS n=1 Tax=Methylocapsa palsarum TaxID=1612308 RepID=A0A1I4BRC9_9HYPH|nr:phosphate ABC transporter substrate-binding protein PstS [Methylocapsa palsarum]SFK70757.1 phosphate transport system substrate-binding protein [Methylocapsa palsarum]